MASLCQDFVCELGKKLDSLREIHWVGVESRVEMIRKLGNIESLLYKFLVCLQYLGLEKRELEHISFRGEMFQKKEDLGEHITCI